MNLQDWVDIVNGLGTVGLLILIAYILRKENKDVKEELKEERTQRIMDLKKHNENSESLLEKVLVTLQDNQRFLETLLNEWKMDINEKLMDIKSKIKNNE